MLLLDAFVKLKDAMCAAVSLRILDPKSPFILETDASYVALGALLKQERGKMNFLFLSTPDALLNRRTTPPTKENFKRL